MKFSFHPALAIYFQSVCFIKAEFAIKHKHAFYRFTLVKHHGSKMDHKKGSVISGKQLSAWGAQLKRCSFYTNLPLFVPLF